MQVQLPKARFGYFSRYVAVLAGLIALASTASSVAATTGWAHQAAGFQSNGAVNVKSLSGGTYSAIQNPSGAVAKPDQSAATQPHTVVVQATTGGFFNYGTDCFILNGPTGGTAIGLGKLTTPTSFTGLAASFSTGSGTGYAGALYLITMAAGGSNGTLPTLMGLQLLSITCR
jgi:hypothetical protein